MCLYKNLALSKCKAIRIFRANKNFYWLGKALSKLSDLYFSQGDMDKFNEIILEMIRVSDKVYGKYYEGWREF